MVIIVFSACKSIPPSITNPTQKVASISFPAEKLSTSSNVVWFGRYPPPKPLNARRDFAFFNFVRSSDSTLLSVSQIATDKIEVRSYTATGYLNWKHQISEGSLIEDIAQRVVAIGPGRVSVIVISNSEKRDSIYARVVSLDSRTGQVQEERLLHRAPRFPSGPNYEVHISPSGNRIALTLAGPIEDDERASSTAFVRRSPRKAWLYDPDFNLIASDSTIGIPRPRGLFDELTYPTILTDQGYFQGAVSTTSWQQQREHVICYRLGFNVPPSLMEFDVPWITDDVVRKRYKLRSLDSNVIVTTKPVNDSATVLTFSHRDDDEIRFVQTRVVNHVTGAVLEFPDVHVNVNELEALDVNGEPTQGPITFCGPSGSVIQLFEDGAAGQRIPTTLGFSPSMGGAGAGMGGGGMGGFSVGGGGPTESAVETGFLIGFSAGDRSPWIRRFQRGADTTQTRVTFSAKRLAKPAAFFSASSLETFAFGTEPEPGIWYCSYDLSTGGRRQPVRLISLDDDAKALLEEVVHIAKDRIVYVPIAEIRDSQYHITVLGIRY